MEKHKPGEDMTARKLADLPAGSLLIYMEQKTGNQYLGELVRTEVVSDTQLNIILALQGALIPLPTFGTTRTLSLTRKLEGIERRTVTVEITDVTRQIFRRTDVDNPIAAHELH